MDGNACRAEAWAAWMRKPERRITRRRSGPQLPSRSHLSLLRRRQEATSRVMTAFMLYCMWACGMRRMGILLLQRQPSLRWVSRCAARCRLNHFATTDQHQL